MCPQVLADLHRGVRPHRMHEQIPSVGPGHRETVGTDLQPLPAFAGFRDRFRVAGRESVGSEWNPEVAVLRSLTPAVGGAQRLSDDVEQVASVVRHLDVRVRSLPQQRGHRSGFGVHDGQLGKAAQVPDRVPGEEVLAAVLDHHGPLFHGGVALHGLVPPARGPEGSQQMTAVRQPDEVASPGEFPVVGEIQIAGAPRLTVVKAQQRRLPVQVSECQHGPVNRPCLSLGLTQPGEYRRLLPGLGVDHHQLVQPRSDVGRIPESEVVRVEAAAPGCDTGGDPSGVPRGVGDGDASNPQCVVHAEGAQLLGDQLGRSPVPETRCAVLRPGQGRDEGECRGGGESMGPGAYGGRG